MAQVKTANRFVRGGAGVLFALSAAGCAVRPASDFSLDVGSPAPLPPTQITTGSLKPAVAAPAVDPAAAPAPSDAAEDMANKNLPSCGEGLNISLLPPFTMSCTIRGGFNP